MLYDDEQTQLIEQHARRLAEQSPSNEYSYPVPETLKCSYRAGECSDGSIGCIIGQAILAAGLDLPVGSLEIGRYLNSAWLRQVQLRHDMCMSWGKAVEGADKVCCVS